MIPQDVEVFVALDPVNMHLSFDRLAALVTERMGRSARDPALYLFLNRRRTLLKALFFDGTGLCQFCGARCDRPDDAAGRDRPRGGQASCAVDAAAGGLSRVGRTKGIDSDRRM